MIISLLQGGLELDVYGSCALRPLRGNWLDLSKTVSGYKFYFSFENSFHCRDYITEKVWWNALHIGLVPVIWGPTRSDVVKYLPKNSFIFVEDFATPEDLINSLRYYDRNEKEFKGFFDWKCPTTSQEKNENELPMTVPLEPTGYCQLCRLLHEDDIEAEKTGSRPYRQKLSMRDWWYGGENPECLLPESVLEWILSFYHRFLLVFEVHIKILSYKYWYLLTTLVFVLLMLFCF